MIELNPQQLLFIKTTDQGNYTIQQTSAYGLVLTLNGEIIESERDGFFYHEMLAHPPLFSHHHPGRVAILGQSYGIIQEVLKHTSIFEVSCIDDSGIDDILYKHFLQPQATDLRIVRRNLNPIEWLQVCDPDSYDVIILSTPLQDTHYIPLCFSALKADGVFILPCPNILVEQHTIKEIRTQAKLAGFGDWHLLNFSQPSHALGSQSLFMTTKSPIFKHLREKEIFNRPFLTRFYNYDMHQAALALPQYVREAFDEVSNIEPLKKKVSA